MSANYVFVEYGANLWCCDPVIDMVEFDSGLAVDIVTGQTARKIPDGQVDGWTWRGVWVQSDRPTTPARGGQQ
jgi:hypothetical protein